MLCTDVIVGAQSRRLQSSAQGIRDADIRCKRVYGSVQVLDEINEQTDQMQQIQDAMAQPIGPAADVDEDELMGELEVKMLSLQPLLACLLGC